MNRETIIEAFAQRVYACADFLTRGRRLQHWNKVTDQPAVFIRHVSDHYDRAQGILPRLTLNLEIWIYSRAGADPHVAPDSGLNDLVDSVEAALAPDNAMLRTLTLGGLVQHCWLEGEVMFDPGDLDAQAKCVLPVKILVP